MWSKLNEAAMERIEAILTTNPPGRKITADPL
jgi:hypothetical protein